MLIKKHFPSVYFGGAGALCLTIALLMKFALSSTPVVEFTSGMFIGLSLVFNITFLISWGRNRGASAR